MSIAVCSSSRIEIIGNSGSVSGIPQSVPDDFHDFISMELTTNHCLLEHLELPLLPFQIFEILHDLLQVTFEPDDDDIFCELVSDGSEKDSNMTFGWVMAAPDGTRLARCSGSAPGCGHSHRAESAGLSSGLTFLALLQKFCCRFFTCSLKLFTDNLGLIERASSRQAFDVCHSMTRSQTDWDLVEEIHQVQQEFIQPVLLQHVKGHQDDTVTPELSPLEAQLNVKADAKAGYF